MIQKSTVFSRLTAPFFHGESNGEINFTIFCCTAHFCICLPLIRELLLMNNNLQFIFKTEDIKRLVESGTDYIVIRSFLESVVLKDGRKAGALRVFADAVNKGKEESTLSVEGCPNPPCQTNEEG